MDGDELRKEVQKYPHQLFSGHVHKLGGGLQRRFGQGDVLFSDAGAAHGSAEDGRHAYAWIRLSRGGLEWHPRAYHEKLNVFRVDADRLDADDLAAMCQTLELPTLPKKLRGWMGQIPDAVLVQPPPRLLPPPQQPGPPTPFIPRAWADYLETSYGHLEPLLNTEEPRRPRIEALYVPLSTTWASPEELKKRTKGRQRGKGRSEPDEAMQGQKSVRRPLADLLTHAEVRHFLLEGVPGGGKSTFARHAAVTALPKDVLPIYLELKNFGAWLGRHPHAEGAEVLLDWAGETLGDLGLSRAALEARLGFGRILWLLDGLDEIFQKELLLRAAHALGCFAASEPLAGERLVILTRPHALQDPEILAELRLKVGKGEVALLSEEEQLEFLRRWFDALYGPEEVNRKKRIEDEVQALVQALQQHPYLAELRQTPLHLGLMASLYFHGRKLPDRRAELFDRAVDWLIDRRFGPKAPWGSERKALNVKQALAHVARYMMDSEAVRELGAAEFQKVLGQGWCSECQSDAARQLELGLLCQELGTHSGLVTVAGFPPVYRFVHLSFQEFLAAWNVGQADDPTLVAKSHLDEGSWKETLLLTAGWLGMSGVHRLVTQFVKELKDARGTPPGLCRRLHLAVQGAVEAPVGTISEPLLAELRTLAVEAISDPAQPCPVADRMELGLALGRLGDPRLGLEKPERWVWVPPGTFQMGGDGPLDRNPIHWVTISQGFWLGKYPVTNQEYAAFVTARGYEEREWWDDEGWKLVRREPLREPRFWRNQTWNMPNLPVVGVSWHEAVAFCRWLSSRWQKDRPCWQADPTYARLPSEAEWECAARGPEGQNYPWGGASPTSELANHEVTGLGRTTPVGIFPAGATPTGLFDLAGNVWEWCTDLWHDGDQRTHTISNLRPKNFQADESTLRIVRGACWLNSDSRLGTASRDGRHSRLASDGRGFRILAASGESP